MNGIATSKPFFRIEFWKETPYFRIEFWKETPHFRIEFWKNLSCYKRN